MFTDNVHVYKIKAQTIALSCRVYSGTPLNGYPSTADTCNIMDTSECISIDFSSLINTFKKPLTADILLFCITDTNFGPI